MVQSFDKEEFIFLSPNIASISLKDGDTIVLRVDNEIWDLDVISQFHENISNCFPKNNVLTILNGMEIGVINRN